MFRLPSIDALTPGPAGCPWTTDGLDRRVRALLAPREPAELAAVLAEAARQSIPVVPIGSGSHLLAAGSIVPEGSWLVWTRGLAKVLDYQPDDLTITVQAGTPLAEVQSRLATAKQHLPHAPARAATATIGGLLATHRPGLTRLGHGPLRDRVLGMTVALSTGELAASGGRVVKNVAGYDLHRLHIGAHGTLGVIAQVTLKVSPMPAGRTVLVARLGDTGAAARFATDLVRAPLFPTAILASSLGGEGRSLRVAFEDVDAGRERSVRDTAALAERHGLPAFARADGDALPSALSDLGDDDGIHVQALVPRGEARMLLAALDHPWPAVVDLGEGLLRWAAPAGGWAAVRPLTDRVRAAGGWSVVTRAPEALWAEIRAARPALASEPRMLALRRALDPAGIMNPGRLLEGLL